MEELQNGRIKRLRLVDGRAVARVGYHLKPRRGHFSHVGFLVGYRRVIHVATDDQHRALNAPQLPAYAPANERIGRRLVGFGIVFAHLLYKKRLILGQMRLGEEPFTNKLANFFHRGEVEHQSPLQNLPALFPILRN